jgi:GntR family transcriptional regulator
MKFFAGRASKIPVTTQLLEQIKLGIALGRLRPGDTLPSVRDLEKELKISKNSIWRVYKQLEKSGLVVLRQGKGAQVRSDGGAEKFQGKLASCERLCEQTLQQTAKLGIHPSSFLNYFQGYLLRKLDEQPGLIFAECNTTETEIYSRQISDLWNVDVKGVTFDELQTQPVRKLLSKSAKVVTNAYHLDELRGLLKGTGASPIALKFRWDRRLLKLMEALPDNQKIVFVFDRRDENGLARLIIEEFRKLLNRPKCEMALEILSDPNELSRLPRGNKPGFMLFSNRIWHLVPQKLKKEANVTRLTLQIDPTSLEAVRERVGVVC